MWPSGLRPGSSSSVATRRITVSLPARRATSCVPHVPQKKRRLPGDDSKARSSSFMQSPELLGGQVVPDLTPAFGIL
jgi:hypothetical protein